MARRRNPVFDPVGREIEAAVGGSMVVVDKWFDDIAELRSDQEMALAVKEAVEYRIAEKKGEGRAVPEGDRDDLKKIKKRVNENRSEIRRLDSRIAKYYRAVLKDISERLAMFKATPGSARYAREYRDAVRRLALAKKQSQAAGVDIRSKISELRGAVAALNEALSFVRPTGIEEHVRGAKARIRGTKEQLGLVKPERVKVSKAERWVETVRLWKSLRARAVKMERYKTGGEKIRYAERHHMKVTPALDVRFRQDVDAADLLMKISQRKIARGEDVSKNLPKLRRLIQSIETVMRPRADLPSPDRVISALGKLRRDLIAYRGKTRRSPKQFVAMQERLGMLKGSIGSKGTVGWSEQDRRTATSSVRDLEALVTSMERVTLPTKLAERLGIRATRKHRVPAKALTKRAGNPKKKATKRKKNPGKRYADTITLYKRPAHGRSVNWEAEGAGIYKWDKSHRPRHAEGINKYGVTDFSGHFAEWCDTLEEAKDVLGRHLKANIKLSPGKRPENPGPNPKTTKKKAKKKATKKKAAKRKTTPEWRRLIRQCQKLWDHYCERPGKKRLKDVIAHLEKMEASTSKKVLDERKKCLRVARAEAKRLKLK